jgi:hypothetical protein
MEYLDGSRVWVGGMRIGDMAQEPELVLHLVQRQRAREIGREEVGNSIL